MGNVSHGRMLIIATILIIACIVGLGIGLGFIITENRDDNIATQCPTIGREQPSTTAAPPYRTSASKEGHYRYAAVASDAGPCSTIGTNIMARLGGSAVDAAIAALLCQCVEHAHSCGIGGGFFMTIYNKSTNTATTIIAREMAPLAANETMFVPKDKSSTEGGLSIGIPGEIKGLWGAWKIGGKLPWSVLFEPTIKMLTQGWAVNGALAKAIVASADYFPRHQGLRETFTNPITRMPYKEGELITMPKLAQTFQIIATEGPDAFYNGSLTSDIASDIQAEGGIITVEDLHVYKAVVKDPLNITLSDGSIVYSPPPPSSGAVFEFILNILDGYGFNSDSLSSTPSAILTWHRIVEAMKFAYAKRTSLGDGDGEDDAFRTELNDLIRNMTSEDYADYVRSQISDTETFGTMYYGPTFYDFSKTGTAHLSVLAPNGDAVSVTSTINLYFGSKVVGEKTGIIFNNEMDDFSTPNTVNSFGVPASEANFIKPLKRPLSSMCPSIVIVPTGHVSLVVGASGGTRITTATALIWARGPTATHMINEVQGTNIHGSNIDSASGAPDVIPSFSGTTIETLWFKMGVKRAIDHSRIHHQLLPPYITIEEGFPQEVIEGLEAIGHNVTMASSAGSVVQGILQPMEEDITANCDYRKGGYPDGF